MNEDKEHISDQQAVGDSQSCCSGGDCCPPSSGGGKWRTVMFVVIVVAAGAVLGRSLLNKSNSSAGQEEQAFAAIQPATDSDTPSSSDSATKVQNPATTGISENTAKVSDTPSQDLSVKPASTLWGPELDSFASLNKAAMNSNGVFLLLAADDEQANQDITAQIEAAAKKIEAGGMRVSAFRLKKGTQNYTQVASQLSVPCVLVMVKGAGASGVSGEINETKLIQAFVAASRPSGCCPTGGPCGPTQ